MRNDVHGEIVRRVELLKRAKKDRLFRSVLFEKSKRDPVFWCNNFVWSFDPRVTPALFPITLFPFQEKYLQWRADRVRNKEQGVIAKSRDMGLSWLNIMDQTHRWLFTSGFKGTFISRKQDLVDKIGDPDSILQKLRMLLQYLPEWMLPKGFSVDTHATFCKIINPANGSIITGQTGDDAGRGGRSTLTDVDEYAFIPRQSKLDAAISQNSDVVIYTSTPNGLGDNFYKKYTNPAIPKFRAHWKEDPRKNYTDVVDGIEVYPWYEKQKQVLDPVILAAEVDINFSSSRSGLFIEAKWVEAAINFPVEDSGKIEAGLDVATTGKNSNVLTIGTSKKVHHIINWTGLDTTQSAYKVLDLWDQYKFEVLKVDFCGVGEGVVSTLRAMDSLPFLLVPLQGSSRPSNLEWPDGFVSHEKFENGRAEWWGIMRWRIKNSFDFKQGLDVNIEDCISIPHNQALLEQLATPLRKWSNRRKILVESKDDLLKKASSPDYADSLSYLLAPYETNDTGWLSDL